jgi:transcriptional regulator with XRE-family HTH domain
MRVEELVGQRIATLRDRAGMSQAQLGEHLGKLLDKPWPRQTVSVAEQGGRKLTAVELFAIAQVLDVHPGQFFVPPPELDAVELPSGATIEVGQLHAFGKQPVSVGSVAPLILMEIPKMIREMERRMGYDRATRDELRRFYERMATSLGMPAEAEQGEGAAQ